MNENPEKNLEAPIEVFDAETQAIIDEWAAKAAAEEIAPENRRECGPEIAEFQEMLEDFERTYDLEALYAVTDLTPDAAPHHPVREPARLALNPLYEKLRVIKDETNITSEQYAELKARWKPLTQAVGMINGNVVDHAGR